MSSPEASSETGALPALVSAPGAALGAAGEFGSTAGKRVHAGHTYGLLAMDVHCFGGRDTAPAA